MNFRENEEAVSPVIGVILMVAITVILAAVIAAFVFGMTGNVETQKNVVLSAKQISNNQLQVTVQSGADLANLEYLRIEVTPDTGSSSTWYTVAGSKSLASTTTTLSTSISVGSTYTTSGTAPLSAGSDHVGVIIGSFADGKEQMLLDTNL